MGPHEFDGVRAWAQALTVYVDIVGISLAGGAGVEDALMVAAQAGTGPQFEELAAALRAAAVVPAHHPPKTTSPRAPPGIRSLTTRSGI